MGVNYQYGCVYNPATDEWETWPGFTTADSGPIGMSLHYYCWDEYNKVLVTWGGDDADVGTPDPTNTGGTYDPATDTWTEMAVTADTPADRKLHIVVPTGDGYIIWGGDNFSGNLNEGGIYDPITESWTPVDLSGDPHACGMGRGIWTGDTGDPASANKMLVWGCTGGGVFTPQ